MAFLIACSCADSTAPNDNRSYEQEKSASISQSLKVDDNVPSRGDALPQREDGELVYKLLSVVDVNGRLIDQVEQGGLSEDIRQRAARPWTYVARGEEWVYEENVWNETNARGESISGYEITRHRNKIVFGGGNAEVRAVRVDPLIHQSLSELLPDDMISLSVKLRDFPDWDLPLHPSPLVMSAQDYNMHLGVRRAAEQARMELMDERGRSLVSWVESVHGRVVASFWSSGWISIEVPIAAFDVLTKRGDVEAIDMNKGSGGSLQSFRLGDAGDASRGGWSSFYDAGIFGGYWNTARNSYGFLTAGIVEAHYLSTNSKMLMGFNDFNVSLYQRGLGFYECISGLCNSVSYYSNSQMNCQNGIVDCEDEGGLGEYNGANHGTRVASVLLGDYTRTQGFNYQLGDLNYSAPFHTAAWEEGASGVARRASFFFYGGNSGNFTSYQSSYYKASQHKVDVLNLSHALYYVDCNIASSRGAEDELENAYDDGVFVVAGAGNNLSTFLGPCSLASPADTPKVFAVNGLDTSESACQNDYSLCSIDPVASGKGGMSARVVFTDMNEIISGIALTAPAAFKMQTTASAATPLGIVDSPNVSTYAFGTSYSAPLVSGAALLLKESFLRIGGTWINSPGRLFAVMLAMGDGWREQDNNYSSFGADKRSGFGRLKMRLLIDPNNPSNPTLPNVRTRATSHTATNIGTTSVLLWSSPMPATTQFLKCVLHEAEDMSAKDHVSDVYLNVKILQPVNGVCSTGGTQVALRGDPSYDIKHMVRVTHGNVGTQVNLSGNCAVAEIVAANIRQSGQSNQIMFCYSSDVKDYE